MSVCVCVRVRVRVRVRVCVALERVVVGLSAGVVCVGCIEVFAVMVHLSAASSLYNTHTLARPFAATNSCSMTFPIPEKYERSSVPRAFVCVSV